MEVTQTLLRGLRAARCILVFFLLTVSARAQTRVSQAVIALPEPQATNDSLVISPVIDGDQGDYALPSSLSSYRIPVLVMTEGRHQWHTTTFNHQGDLIAKVVSGELLAACVADDVLRVSGQWDRVREIYVNGDGINPLLTNAFPAISFGWRSDLSPELQECISNTFENHSWLKDDDFINAYKGIKGIPVGGIVKIDSADRLWAGVLEIMKLPVPLPNP